MKRILNKLLCFMWDHTWHKVTEEREDFNFGLRCMVTQIDKRIECKHCGARNVEFKNQTT